MTAIVIALLILGLVHVTYNMVVLTTTLLTD